MGTSLEPRCLTREQAAAYCGISTDGFSSWQARGIVPGPMPGTKRWDRRALDAALDQMSGLRKDEPEEEDAFTAWKRSRNASETAGRR